MIKITIGIFVLTLLVNTAQAQTEKPVKKTVRTEPPAKVIKKQVVTAPPSTPPPANNTPYYLTAARVTIVTGNDNKEQASRASITLNTSDGGCWPSDETTGPCGMYDFNFATRTNDEYKINSVTDIQLRTPYQFPGSFPGGAGDGWRYINLSLSKIQTYGLTLLVIYDPNFFMDAWKIERVTLTLEFKDLKGNPHPSMGSMTIPFLFASALLTETNSTLKCETDKYLMPKN